MKLTKKIIALVAVLALTVSHLGIAYAANGSNGPQASPTLTSYGVCLDPGENKGELDISFDVTAAGWADSLGVSYFEVHQASNGKLVDTVRGTTGNGLNSSGFSFTNTYTYTGVTSGAYYYIIIAVYAEKDGIHDSRTLTTGSVKAP